MLTRVNIYSFQSLNGNSSLQILWPLTENAKLFPSTIERDLLYLGMKTKVHLAATAFYGQTDVIYSCWDCPEFSDGY